MIKIIHNNDLLNYIENFRDYTLLEPNHEGLSKEIEILPNEVLNKYGYFNGKYNVSINLQRKIFLNTFARSFKLIEISPSRTELLISIVDGVDTGIVTTQVRSYELRRNRYPHLKDFILTKK